MNTEQLKIQLHPAITMTDEQFFHLCQLNQDVQIEPSASGEGENVLSGFVLELQNLGF